MEVSGCILKAGVIGKNGRSYSEEALESACKQLHELNMPIQQADNEDILIVNPRFLMSGDSITFIGTAPTKLSRYNSVFGR